MSDDLDIPAAQRLNPWEGIHAIIKADRTEERDVEGALSSAKTTLCLDCELDAVRDNPGIHCFWFRYSDTDTRTKLRPAVEELIRLRGEEQPDWDRDAMCYDWPNGSRAYMFGLRAVSGELRYAKLRGLGVARIYCDQAEELPADIAQELRARLRQRGFSHQITFSPNPVPTRHWLARKDRGGFPEDNSVKGRKYFPVSLYDNAYNLPPETIARLERTYPPEHPKHGVVILGRRGPNVIGDPIYEYMFKRDTHVKPIPPRKGVLYEALDVWKHNPTWVVMQRPYSGGMWLQGGIIGQQLFLAQFLDIVKEYRSKWFGESAEFKSCATAPEDASQFSVFSILREAGFECETQAQTNSHDVVLAIIEQLANYMRRRTVTGDEAFLVNSDPERWQLATREGVEPCPFLAEAFESDYVWDEHSISVESKQVRRPKADDWAEHGMHCVEALELNFGAAKPTDSDIAAKKKSQQALAASASFTSTDWMGS